ncbi:MAG: SH3 domain-containing protein [Leptolyngbyaceae cyanobacterium]
MVPNNLQAQTIQTCPTAYDDVPVGVEYAYRDPEPAYIYAEDINSSINARSGPGTEHEVLMLKEPEDYVDVVAQAFSTQCDTWLKVQAPITGRLGWVHIDYVYFAGGPRGLWD